ncbi:cytochrome P450 [Streptacidiphilus fuscans]|uniref:Cytochrome P450 n=1 Tax=Streptacidiphilus fuscans TaxID=2789292 RepID=A0A931B3M2_9ACTN|nr:cytochrome P450 [Streptacidiphilus fuscans]MBF9069688.1 cytochrome P450 [Streptacidiphilus fuscans]
MTAEAQVLRDPIYNPLAPDVIADPHPFYRRLREHRRVYWHAVLDSWVLTGYEECRQVLSDTAAFASDFRRVGEEIPDAHLTVQSLDPPEHGAIRHLLVTALHEQSPTAMADRVAEIATAHVAALRGQDRPVDLVREFARPVALQTMCEFLGVEAPDGPRFEELSNAIVLSMDAGLDPSRAEPGTRARGELARLMGEWLRDSDGAAFIGAARRAALAAPEVSPALLANSLRTVLHAGYESVSRLLGNALARLVATPALLHGTGDPARPDGLNGPGGLNGLDGLVEELIRLDGPVQADARVATEDRVVDGQKIRRGEVVILFLAAANRDPGVFAHPDDVDPGRRRGVHIAFGRGAHACLGANLATAQLRAVVTALAGSGLGLTAAGAPQFDPTATLRGLRSLPVLIR